LCLKIGGGFFLPIFAKISINGSKTQIERTLLDPVSNFDSGIAGSNLYQLALAHTHHSFRDYFLCPCDGYYLIKQSRFLPLPGNLDLPNR
jgi:hypothetical protein